MLDSVSRISRDITADLLRELKDNKESAQSKERCKDFCGLLQNFLWLQAAAMHVRGIGLDDFHTMVEKARESVDDLLTKEDKQISSFLKFFGSAPKPSARVTKLQQIKASLQSLYQDLCKQGVDALSHNDSVDIPAIARSLVDGESSFTTQCRQLQQPPVARRSSEIGPRR